MPDSPPLKPLTPAEVDTWSFVEAEMARSVLANLKRHEGEADEEWARRIAAATLGAFCSQLGGSEWYIPRLPSHHRARRDTQLRLNFNGGNLDSVAESATLSSRHTRRIVSLPKI